MNKGKKFKRKKEKGKRKIVEEMKGDYNKYKKGRKKVKKKINKL